jgi:hypothetical protein
MVDLLMKRSWIALFSAAILCGFWGLVSLSQPVRASPLLQQPTGSQPTVTSTVTGPMAVIIPQPEPQINIRSGPNTKYDKVGVLLVGQRVPAKGRSAGGDWILVEYPGVPGGEAWVWSAYVKIEPPVQLPIVEPPPTPTPQFTLTVDPTLAAKFIVTAAPTRLPTYTPPPPLVIPTFTAINGSGVGNIPMGFIILGLASLGVLFGLISLTQGR